MNAYEELLKKYISICRKIKEFKKFSKKLSSENNDIHFMCNDIHFICTYSNLMCCLTREPLLFVSDDLSLSDFKKSIKLRNMFENKSRQLENYFIDNFRIIKKT